MADDDENDEFDENVEADDMFEYVVSQVCKHKALQSEMYKILSQNYYQ